MVDRAKVQRAGDRIVDDAQLALQKLTDQLNASPLALNTLQFFSVAISQIVWVGAGNLLIQTLFVAPEACILRGANWVSTLALAAGGNNRSFTLELWRAGSKISTLATRDTSIASISATTVFPITLSTTENDLKLQKDDIVLLILDGAGGKPALNNGTITLYFEKL